MKANKDGFTLVELMLSFVIISILGLSLFTLLNSLLHSAVIAKRQAVGLTLATSQIEYLKSLPYNNLAVAGGAIVSSSTVPAQIVKTVDGAKYTVKTSIVYADDAYDGCGSYPTLALKQQYCRNYPAPSGAPTTDTNPADYKSVRVSVTDVNNLNLASVDSTISALVAETASNTGALFVKVVDDGGNPVVGAAVRVTNSSVSPVVDVSDSTDTNGVTIFYGLPPSTTNYKYVIAASMSGSSSLTTIAPTASLQPTYPSQNLFAQNSSFATLTLKPQASNSLAIETTDVNGAALGNVKFYIKGGYKQYTATTDTTYYYDTLTPSDTRPTSSASGTATLTNLVPGTYIFCGDTGATSCTVGGTTYYLAAAVPYGGVNPFNPIVVPSNSTSPALPTYDSGGSPFIQKVRLIMTANSNFPRITSMTPYDGSVASGTLSNTSFTITGANLPCSSTAASCATSVKFTQGSNTYTASCTGTSAGVSLNCTANFGTAVVGNLRMIIGANGYTFTLPDTPLIGGFDVNS